jgi:two-component system response regulator YesN
MDRPLPELLIAEDEEITRESLKKYFLQNAKLIGNIHTASDGDEALGSIVENRPEYMIIDVQMPCKTGLQVMREAARAGICPKTIILSGYGEFEYAQEALRCGAVDYILKPCHPGEMLSKIEHMIASDGRAADQRAEAPGYGNRFVDLTVAYIEKNFKSDIPLTKIAEDLGISAAYLSSLFAQTMKCSFVDYINQTRIKNACSYLCDMKMKTYEVAYKVGFHDEKYFIKVFKKVTGMSPSQFRNSIGY